MPFTTRYIDWKNFELKDLRIELKRLQSEPEDTLIEMQGADPVAILETVDQDEDKTKSVRGRALSIIFNSDVSDPFNPDTAEVFAEDDVDWQGRIIMDDGSIPFIGNLIKDDITEAFQPRPNPVQLICGDGFGALKQIELTESDGDIPRGHYRIIDYIYLCLRHINYDELPMFVAFNLYELDTDPVTSHAFIDTYLEALTFETDVNKRDDCYTVLEKILDALGCFITFDNSAYYIIRWDEWDDSTGSVTTLRFAEFAFDGLSTFGGYSLVDVDRNIASDQTPDYEGHYLSFDSAQRRFQHKYNAVRHIYKFEQPKDIPCNADFLRGDLITNTPTLKTYDPECWTFHKGPPDVTNDGTSYIKVVLQGGQETERYFVFEVQPTNLQYYIESQPIPVKQFDKFDFSVDIRHDGQVETAAGIGSYRVAQIRLYADDNTYWTFHAPDPQGFDPLDYWVASDVTWATNNKYFDRGYDGSDDDTIWNSVGITFDEMKSAIPQDGYITILLHQTKKPDEFQTHFSNLKFKIYPIIDGSYGVLEGQETQVGYSGGKTLEKQFYIGESPHPLYKGALKKFSGGDYVLTESWQNFNDIFVLSDIGGTLSRFIGYQWYNTYRLTRTVIESNVQGLTDSIPSLINRWFIKHGDQDNKYFMLTSIREMNFGNCGWVGVFVETSYSAGDRLYSGATDPTFLNFKYIR
jgi:hypothetical protein